MERALLRRLALSIPGSIEAGEYVFMCDPGWRELEREQVRSALEFAKAKPAQHGWLCLPTGGTSGRLRFACHDEDTLGAAVAGFQRHFSCERIDCVGVLPGHHVSGFMARLRSAATGGVYIDAEWKSLASGEWPQVPVAGGAKFISLVPTQLQRILSTAGGADLLRGFDAVFVGGGPTWPGLAEQAASSDVPVSLTYGMTETGAMVTAQQPRDFLKGARDVGRPLAHAQIELLHGTEGKNGDAAEGLVQIQAESLFRGYFPNTREERLFLTEDVGTWTPSGALQVLGRRDAVIITGGKKVWPQEVEAALRSTGVFSDAAVIGFPDAEWGEIVVACHPGGLTNAGLEKARASLNATLARYKHPKRYLAVKPWPRNAQGKINRAELIAYLNAVG